MRHLLLVSCAFPVSLNAQNLVDQLPHNRTVLLEEFTAINCGNCPAGHVDAAAIEAAHPGQVTLVELHAGGLAIPGTGQPDFMNSWATELLTHYGVTSTPKGLVDRLPYAGPTVLSRTNWAAAVDAALALPSPVNLGLASSFDPLTRELTVQVELYYTANSAGGSDFISVLLKEDHLIGWQSDYVNGSQPNYDHVNVLRAYLTPTWGDEVTSTALGSSVLRTYTMIVPAGYDENNCSVLAHVGEYQGALYMAKEVAAVGGSTAGLSENGSAPAVIRTWPQPASELVNFALPAIRDGGRLVIHDLGGRVVFEAQVATGERSITIDAGAWPVGTYSCTLINGSTLDNSKMVVVR